MTEDEKQALCQRKNDWYVEYIKKLEKSELLPGVENFLKQARAAGIKIALGSASKNSPLILDRLGITELFDAVVDGTRVNRAKPDPEVFVTGAEDLGIDPGIKSRHNILCFGIAIYHILWYNISTGSNDSKEPKV